MAEARNISLLPVYLVVGEDQLKRQTVVERLRKRLATLGELSFNSDFFQGTSANAEEILAAANTLPFASEKRLVQVDAVEKLKKADVDAIVKYLDKPCASTVLCLVGEGKLNKSSKLYKACAAIAPQAVIDCTPFKRYELGGKVREMARGHGVEFTPGAASTLIDLVGTNTVALDSEIRKVALAHRGADAVNENEIMSMVARTAEIKPWEVVDSFSGRKMVRCLNLYHRYIEAQPTDKERNQASISLLYQCSRRIRELITVKSLGDRGQQAQAAKVLGIPDWRVKNLFGWAQSYSLAELETSLIASRDVEKSMKSGGNPPELLLDWLMSTLVRK